MSIMLDESIMGIWYVHLSETFDVMISLAREGEGYKLTGRTRTYNSLDPWDEKDRKHWFSIPVKAANDNDAATFCRRFIADGSLAFCKEMRIGGAVPIHELIRGKQTPEEFGKLLMSMPWAHMQEVKTH